MQYPQNTEDPGAEPESNLQTNQPDVPVETSTETSSDSEYESNIQTDQPDVPVSAPTETSSEPGPVEPAQTSQPDPDSPEPVEGDTPEPDVSINPVDSDPTDLPDDNETVQPTHLPEESFQADEHDTRGLE